MKKLVKDYGLFKFILVAVLLSFVAGPMIQASAATTLPYNPAYLISDNIFTDNSSMSAAQIQSFLVSENSYLQSYYDVEECGSTTGVHYAFYTTYYSCGTSQLASKIIYDASQAYGINPRSILATMEKEQSLITDPSPTQVQLNCAMGYNSCSGFSGFFYQVDNGAWQFRADIELMSGNNYWINPQTGTPYTPANYSCAGATSLYSTGLYPGNSVTFTNPGYLNDPAGPNGDPITITLANASTAALYCYTPYVGPFSQTGYSGSYNFVQFFELWFGSVASPCYNSNNLSGVATGASIVPYRLIPGQPDYLALTIPNNTGSACAEAHVWNYGYQSFINDYASNLPVFNPANGQIISADLYGNGQDELIYVDYTGTGSGNIEIHVWNSSLSKFNNDYATNLPSAPPTDGQVIAGDFYGNGKDELAYVKYQNTGSGKIEVHIWNPTFTGFLNDYATNLPSAPPTDGQVIAGDFYGNGQDNLAYVKYQNTGSGKIEVHIWNPTFTGFLNDYATNLPVFTNN